MHVSTLTGSGRKPLAIAVASVGLVCLGMVGYGLLAETPEERMEADLKTAVRQFFVPETRQAGWVAMMQLGAEDPALLFRTLDATHAAHVMSADELGQIINGVAAAHGVDAVVGLAQGFMRDEGLAGKLIALEIFRHYNTWVPEVHEAIANRKLATVIRRECVLLASDLEAHDAVPQLVATLRDAREPGSLREACAESLVVLSPADILPAAETILEHEEGAPRSLQRRMARLAGL